MKSSSDLFPVELVSAEHRGSYFEDLYSVKHNRSADRSVEVAVLHLHAAKDNSGSDSVLFVHDVFESHWQWMDNGINQQLINELLQAGYSIWLYDWRGHGSSKSNRESSLNTLAEMAATDLPAVIEFIDEKSSGSALSVVSAGQGAQLVMRGLPVIDRQTRNFYFIDACSIVPSRRYWLPFIRWYQRSRLLGKRWVINNRGEHEPAAFFIELVQEAGWFSRYRRQELKGLLKHLSRRSHDVFWLCTTATAERRACRLLGPHARAQRIDASDPLAALRAQFIGPTEPANAHLRLHQPQT